LYEIGNAGTAKWLSNHIISGEIQVRVLEPCTIVDFNGICNLDRVLTAGGAKSTKKAPRTRPEYNPKIMNF
jgi:hypothetical protein